MTRELAAFDHFERGSRSEEPKQGPPAAPSVTQRADGRLKRGAPENTIADPALGGPPRAALVACVATERQLVDPHESGEPTLGIALYLLGSLCFSNLRNGLTDREREGACSVGSVDS